MSKYGVFSGPNLPVFGMNTGKYGPEKTPYLNTFHAVSTIPLRVTKKALSYCVWAPPFWSISVMVTPVAYEPKSISPNIDLLSRLGHDVIKILFIVERSTSYISLEGEFYADQLFCSTHVLKVNFHQAK